ncbi:translation initiation factor IF-2-like [Bubalus bubalis]|uniref:translation initiation factor IF-2-like n=1 Tax=Bubalus bubalis TaxID=89462 RepID=UPI001E1B6789|nr:translation initiation factor IF-2-like [Bubalus bubalis]
MATGLLKALKLSKPVKNLFTHERENCDVIGATKANDAHLGYRGAERRRDVSQRPALRMQGTGRILITGKSQTPLQELHRPERKADRTACCPAPGQRRDLLTQLANSRRTRCPSAPACRARLPSPARPARRSRRSGPPNSNLRTPGKLRADLPARFPSATESRFPGRTGGRTCAQLRLPRAPRRRTHSPGGSLPSPRRPAPATWALASERARAQQPGARGLLGTQGARWGARGGPAAPARHPLRPAPAPITALSAGRGLWGPRAGPQRPGPAGSAGSPGWLRRRVRSERASGRASGERARGRVGGRRRGGEDALGRARWAGGGEERVVGGRRRQTALCVAGPGAAETPAPPGAQVRALGTAAAPPPRAHPRARTPARPSSTALLTAPRRPSPSQENPEERWK